MLVKLQLVGISSKKVKGSSFIEDKTSNITKPMENWKWLHRYNTSVVHALGVLSHNQAVKVEPSDVVQKDDSWVLKCNIMIIIKFELQ